MTARMRTRAGRFRERSIIAAMRPRLGPLRSFGLLALLGLATVTACPNPPSSGADDDAEPGAKPDSQPGSHPGSQPDRTTSPGGPEFVEAPASGDVVDIVQRELARAEGDDRRLLVYVGATWCEPCRYFHDAVEDGTYDEVFPRLRLVEFDLDRDRDRLQAAGYTSRYIPLFAIPDPDGRASGRQHQGGIKGPGAVALLRDEVTALLQAEDAR